MKFISNVWPNGILVLNKDDKNLFSLKNRIEKISKKHELKVYWYSVKNAKNPDLRRVLRVPGQHNLSNALGAYTLARALKISEKGAFRGISGYKGAWRRMEFRGILNANPSTLNARVYDDYAHHPSEIKATLSAFREKFPKGKIICVFQPHQANRLKSLFKEFTTAFDTADILILLPVFKVAGRDSSDSKNIGRKLFTTIKRRNKNTFYVPYPAKIRSFIKKNIINDPCFKFHASWIIVMMGAGDIYKLTPKLIFSCA